MNIICLLVVFTLGVVFTFVGSLLAEYVKSEVLRNQSETEVQELIENRRKIFERSRSLTSIPDGSQLSVFDTELVPDINQVKEVVGSRASKSNRGIHKNLFNIIKS